MKRLGMWVVVLGIWLFLAGCAAPVAGPAPVVPRAVSGAGTAEVEVTDLYAPDGSFLGRRFYDPEHKIVCYMPNSGISCVRLDEASDGN